MNLSLGVVVCRKENRAAGAVDSQRRFAAQSDGG